jgi:hypothetical protein
MMRFTLNSCAVGALLVGAVSHSFALAGTIVDPPAPVISGPGLGFAQVLAIVTLNPNNDNQTGQTPLDDNDIIVPAKRFNTSDYIDIVFTVSDSDGVTEYQVREFVDNNTGVPWVNYTMQLGFGTGPGFVLSGAGDGLDFDAPNYDPPPSSATFSNVVAPDEDTLVFSGGLHGSGAQLYLVRIDVPDLSLGAPPFAGTFTLRQFPTPIPEPSAVALVGIALLGLAAARRRGNK